MLVHGPLLAKDKAAIHTTTTTSALSDRLIQTTQIQSYLLIQNGTDNPASSSFMEISRHPQAAASSSPHAAQLSQRQPTDLSVDLTLADTCVAETSKCGLLSLSEISN